MTDNRQIGTERAPLEKGRCQSRFQISLERAEPPRPIIHGERRWRRPDGVECLDQGRPRLVVSRWRGACPNEHSFEITGDYHILAIALEPSRYSLWLGGRPFPHQEIPSGAIQITQPGILARAVHFHPYDILHLHIPNRLLMECFEWSSGRWPSGGIVLRDPHPAPNALLRNLGAALLSAAESNDPHNCLFADFLGLALVTHIVACYGDIATPAARRSSALPRWRLKRVFDFVEANLTSPVTLADLARSAGLSPMHFAAQFRAATGLRPHEYALRRRIEVAQIKLATTCTPIAELALEVGFSSQSHFTVVFKRFSGLTPNRWRQNHRG